MLEVKGLHAGYGRIPILNGVTFAVAAGSVVGVLGHNGMGKTTLIRTLMGYLPATSGTVRLDGDEITHLPPHERARRGIGYVPQGRQIFPQLTVRENLRLGAIRRTPANVERAFAVFPTLVPLLERAGGALSGGEQQLLAVARCLAGEPSLVLLDEPTEGIQPSIIDLIGDTLDALARTRGLTLIVVEQNLAFIARLAKRILIIQKGAIVRELAPQQSRDEDIIEEFVGMRARPSQPIGGAQP